ncbi:aminopeptidase [Deferribacter thermophilus]|uniref:aminopeptidase n=1 Tax=Deferribacter thermophilus TaxID=53573 RepID=UPI003C28F1E6
MQKHAENIVNKIFELKEYENFLILSELYSDKINISEKDKIKWQKLNEFTKSLYTEIKKIHKNTELIEYESTLGHGKEPNLTVWNQVFGNKTFDFIEKNSLADKLLNKTLNDNDKDLLINFVRNNPPKYHCIMALTHFSTSHTFFRKLFTQAGNGRYASMPLFEPEMFNSSMQADIDELAAFTEKLANYLNNFEQFHITSANGTDIIIVKEDRKVIPDTGKLNKPKSFGNLPAGEAFLAPVEGKSHGILVLEYAPTRKLNSPIRLTVENGAIVKIEGGEPYFNELTQKINAHPNNKFVAELGIGTNKHAKMLDNILESEKIFGTVHIAFGDNHAFGGCNQAPFHEDYLVLNPTVYGIDKNGNKKVILKDKSFFLE